MRSTDYGITWVEAIIETLNLGHFPLVHQLLLLSSITTTYLRQHKSASTTSHYHLYGFRKSLTYFLVSHSTGALQVPCIRA